MATPPEFPNATVFRTVAAILDPGNGEQLGSIALSFTIEDIPSSGNYPDVAVTPLEVAEAIDALYQAKGWPHLLFSGRQSEAPLNPAAP